MLRAKRLRTESGLSGLEVSRRARIAPSTLSQIESGRFRPYPVQLERLAQALCWEGDPNALLEEVSDRES